LPVDDFVLGKDCEFRVDGNLLPGVRDVYVRRRTKEIEGTGYGHSAESTVVTHRTYEIEVEVLRKSCFAALAAAEETGGICQVATSGGFRDVSGNYTVCESESSEPLDDGVIGRFTLKQWMHGT
jgi:hypothetical protein